MDRLSLVLGAGPLARRLGAAERPIRLGSRDVRSGAAARPPEAQAVRLKRPETRDAGG